MRNISIPPHLQKAGSKARYPIKGILSEPSDARLGIKIDNRMGRFKEELREFYHTAFGHQPHFTVAYGSYPYGLNSGSSDLDMVTLCEAFDSAQLERVVDFVLDFHRRHGLEIDAEVPHDKKLLATFDQAERALAGEGFERIDNRIVVPPVAKTKEFLESEEIVLRLLLNILTGKGIFIEGDKKKHENLVMRARERLVGIMFSIENRGFFTIDSFLESLMGPVGTDGELYLGYKHHPAIRKYLKCVFNSTFRQLAVMGKLERLDGGRYAVGDHGWLASITTGRKEHRPSVSDHSTNLNPYGPPAGVLETANDMARHLSTYPEASPRSSLGVVSRFFGVPEENLRLFNGSTEFFFLAPEALEIGRGIVIVPSFWFSLLGLKRWNREIIEFPTRSDANFQVDFAGLADQIRSYEGQDSLSVYFCNPNNPSGNLIRPDELLRLAESFPSVTFIVDETYLFFNKDYDRLTLAKQVPTHENLIVVASLSKFFTVPGVRIGCVVASPDKIMKLEESSVPYSFGTVSGAVLGRLFDEHFIQESRGQLDADGQRLMAGLKRVPQLEVYPSEANFFLCRIKDQIATSADMHVYLKRRGFLIRDCNGYGNLDNSFIRIAIRTKEENAALLKAIRDFFIERASKR